MKMFEYTVGMLSCILVAYTITATQNVDNLYCITLMNLLLECNIILNLNLLVFENVCYQAI